MLILYFLLLIIAVFFFILYVGNFSLYLLAFLVVIGVVLFFLQLYLSRKIKIDFRDSIQSTTAQTEVPVDIKITNPTFIPIANMSITVEYTTAFDNRKSRTKINTPVYPRETQLLTLKLSSLHYGIVKLNFGKCYIYDILRLFKFKVRYTKKDECINSTSMTVFPEYEILDNPISNYNDCGLETDEYSKDKKGDDPSQIFDIHEYVAGDKINRIHWKLSAKQNKTMVKDYSLPLTDSVSMLINPDVDADKEKAVDSFDTIIETAASISKYLTDNSFSHKAMWFNAERKEIEAINVTDNESHVLFMNELLRTPVNTDNHKELLTLLDDTFSRKCGHLLYISSKVDENIISFLSESGYAQRYTCLVASDEPIQNTKSCDISELTDIIYIKKNYVGKSIMDLYL